MDKLILYYQQLLNLPNATFTRIDHDDTMVAVVFKIVQPNVQPLILKLCPRPKNYIREAYFLKHLANKLPVSRLINVIEPQDIYPGGVLMECLPGTLLSEVSLTGDLAYQAGSLLARVHLNRTGGYGDVIDLDNLYTDPRVHFTHKFDEGFDECRGNLPETLLSKCRIYYEKHVDLLLKTDGPCFIHRDFRPGNIMVDKGVITGVIDWASGRAGFAEEDFVPYGWPEDNATRQAFLAGYASIRPVPDYQKVMPLLQLSRAIAVIGFLIRENTWAGLHAAMYQTNRRFIEELLK